MSRSHPSIPPQARPNRNDSSPRTSLPDAPAVPPSATAEDSQPAARTDVITAKELEAVGVPLAQVRCWPVPEYTDSDGRPYWLWADLAPWLTHEGSND
jgi:hypothetical protein